MAKVRLKLKTDLAGEVFPRKLSKSEVRQLQIIENTIKLCAKGGTEAISFEKIANACGVTRHLVIHYFPDRDDLIEQAMEYVWASLKLFILERVDKESDAKAKLEVYISSNLEWARKNKELATFFILFLHYASTRPKFKKINSELMRLGQERVLGILNQGISDGSFYCSDTPAIEAKDIQVSVLGHIVSFVCEDSPFDPLILENKLKVSILNRMRSAKG
ncbi:MAG: TetR/AcrR family transcriptional regulator [Pseudobdellovibrionaceae bacterium]